MQLKDRKHCIFGAIQKANPVNPIHDYAGLVSWVLWTFWPTKKNNTGHYHKGFSSANFSEWWRMQLLPNISVKSRIIIENAKYNMIKPQSKRKPAKTAEGENKTIPDGCLWVSSRVARKKWRNGKHTTFLSELCKWQKPVDLTTQAIDQNATNWWCVL